MSSEANSAQVGEILSHADIRYGAIEVADAVKDNRVLAWIASPVNGAEGTSFLPTVNMVKDQANAAFAGTPDEFLTAYKGAEGLDEQLRNRVRKCASCGKPNAFTLMVCNACGASLKEVEIGFTPNIFMGFVYGIQKGPFPFTISIRSQDERMLVFDDLLSLTPAHLNCIPTDVYLADFRGLLLKPTAGLELMERMFDSCFAALKAQFLDNPAYREAVLRDSADLTDDDLKALVVAGLNYPPSQYQLHLQFMLPPFLPFQWRQCLAGVHFTYERFFPIEYVRDILNALIAAGKTYECAADTPVAETIAYFKGMGVDYDAIHKAQTERFYSSHRRLAQWDASKFEYVVVGEDVLQARSSSPAVADISASSLVNEDKNKLQNYGRPYSAGKPSGTYYKYPKQPHEVKQGL